MGRTLVLKALAKVLAPERGCTDGSMRASLSKWAQTGGMPCDRTPAGPLFDLEEARAWLVVHKPQRKPAAEPAKAAEPAEAMMSEDSRTRLAAELRASGTPLEAVRVGFRVAQEVLLVGVEQGRLGFRALDDFKRAAEELRRSEEGYLELARRRGELIERDVAKAVVGAMVQRLLRILNNAETMLGTQVEVWLSDEAFRTLSTEARARHVGQWLAGQARGLRDMEAAEIEAVIAAEIREEVAA